MEPTTQRSWMGRNWKWFVPCGCAGVALLFFLLCGGFGLIMFLGIRSTIRSSAPYAQALKLAQHNPAVIQELGEPIEAGFLVVGSVNDAGPTGNADLIISLSGPKNTATAHVVAHKSEGQWNFDNAIVTVNNTGTTIDLLTRPGRRVRHITTGHRLPQPELPLSNP